MQLDGNFVRKKRESLGLTQEQICLTSGLKQVWISEVELNKHRNRSPRLVKMLAEALGETTENLFVGAMSLPQCQLDFVDWENGLAGDEVVIRCIGLDMANGWQHVVQTINNTVANLVRLEFLVIHDPHRKMIFKPSTFRMWTEQSSKNLELIREEIGIWNLKPHREVSILFKGYAESPDVHGVQAEKNGDTRWWITRCKPICGEATGFHWGEGEYHRVPDAENIRAIEFNERFSRLWRDSQDVLIEKTVRPVSNV